MVWFSVNTNEPDASEYSAYITAALSPLAKNVSRNLPARIWLGSAMWISEERLLGLPLIFSMSTFHSIIWNKDILKGGSKT